MKHFTMAATKADKMVTRVLLFVVLVSGMVVLTTSCSADGGGTDRVPEYQAKGDTTITLSFNQMTMESMDARTRGDGWATRGLTRGTLTEAGMARLDVWISDGTTTQNFHQAKTDDGFGTVTATLNKTKTYTIYAIAHKASAACTLTDGIISYPDDSPKESVWYTNTFSPATASSLNCAMQRITGKFTLSTTDAVPEAATKMRFVIKSTATRYSVSAGPTNVIDRTVDINSFTRKPADNTASFNINILAASDAVTNFDITVTAYDTDNNLLQSRTFADVPIRNGYVTRYAGTFFIDSGMTMSFTASDWIEYDETTY